MALRTFYNCYILKSNHFNQAFLIASGQRIGIWDSGFELKTLAPVCHWSVTWTTTTALNTFWTISANGSLSEFSITSMISDEDEKTHRLSKRLILDLGYFYPLKWDEELFFNLPFYSHIFIKTVTNSCAREAAPERSSFVDNRIKLIWAWEGVTTHVWLMRREPD